MRYTAVWLRPVVGLRTRVLFLWLTILPTLPAQAERLTLAAIQSVPPYVIAASDSGVVVDMVREALALTEHRLGEIQYVTNLRAQRALEEGRVDLAMHIPEAQPGVYHSHPLVHYWNVAISLQSEQIQVRSLEGLAGKRIIAFQNAQDLLGDAFQTAVSRAAKYAEQPNQRSQVVALFRGGADVLIMDLHIFRYYRTLLEEERELDFHRPIRVHSILPPSPRTIAFRDEALRDEFNAALRRIQENGTYARILERYYFWGR